MMCALGLPTMNGASGSRLGRRLRTGELFANIEGAHGVAVDAS